LAIDAYSGLWLKARLSDADIFNSSSLLVTMRTFFARLWVLGRTFVGWSSSGRASGLTVVSSGGAHTTRLPPASEAGDTLIEVLISAMLVGLIVIGTLTGFNAATRVSADQRHHNQAAVLAAQSQELLRTDSAATLDALQITPHTYTAKVDGQTYTITQEAALVNDSKQTSGCNATAGSSAKQNGNYFRIKSSVTWRQLNEANRKPVTQASIITPPDGSALEVDVTNGGTPEEDVSGVTVISNANGEEPLTTGASGCVIYAGVPSTSANVEAYKVGDVAPSGAYKVSANELTIAPNLTTHYPVTFAPGGAITALFTYEGKTTYTHKNNAGNLTMPAEEIKGDTFVAYNSGIKVNPDFEIGSVSHAIGTGNLWEPLPSQYATTATTPIEANYPTGNLFPFSSSWAVYAGDCTENNASTITKNAPFGSNGSTLVPPTGNVPVPLSHVALNVYQGSGAKNTGSFAETPYPIAITNTKCKSFTPNNESLVNIKHIQNTTAGKEFGGHLEDAFQPFGEYELCLYNETPHKKTYRVSYINNTVAGSAPAIYLGQLTEKEKTEQKASKEKEEETAKKTKETEEKAKITQWAKEETEHKITHTERIAKETAAKTARLNEEAATKTTRETAETKESEEAKESKVVIASGQASC
jgi:Tfp pilus assembly protein PilV